MKNLLFAMLISAVAATSHAADLRLGLIGLDTSHVTAFTEVLNNPAAKDHVAGAKVVAAFKGGSPDIPSSSNRVDGYTAELRDKYGVKIVESIEQLCKEVDAVLIESVDGRPHLAQAKIVIAAKKPLFIDKPVAGTLHDALEIFRLAKAAGVPVFSSSSLRYAKTSQAVRAGSLGKVLSAETTSPAELEPHHPDLYWYGVHGCESLFTVMGTGCESVERRTTADGKIEVVGKWKGGRTGTFRESQSHGAHGCESLLGLAGTGRGSTERRTGIFRESKSYGGVAHCEKGDAPVGAFDGYVPLVVEIVKFFQTRVSPVPAAETIELFAFMEAADESKRRGGKSVKLAEVLAKAKKTQK